MANPCIFEDKTALAVRETENTTADWDTGMNNASCNPGIGINSGGQALLDGEPNGWTLTDQNEADRTPQNGQSIGGTGLNGGDASVQAFSIVTNSATGDGTVTATGSAQLVTLAAGWVTV